MTAARLEGTSRRECRGGGVIMVIEELRAMHSATRVRASRCESAVSWSLYMFAWRNRDERES